MNEAQKTIAQVNDAVVISFDDEDDDTNTICRVISTTFDGRAVVKEDYGFCLIESKPGTWPIIGYYLPRPKPWWDVFGIREDGWDFVPHG